MRLSEQQHAVLAPLDRAGDHPLTVAEIARESGLDQSIVMSALALAERWGWVRIETTPREEIVPGPQAAEAAAGKLPERQFLEELRKAAGGSIPMKDVVAWAGSRGLPVNDIVKWGGARGWFSKAKGELVLSEAGRGAAGRDADEAALEIALRVRPLHLDELARHGLDAERVRALLKGRGEIAKIKERHLREIRALPPFAQFRSAQVVRQVNQLTSEDIQSGRWREIELRPYDVTLPAETARPAKAHPLARILHETRQAFLRMGFTEIVSPMVESAFWDFDALFQPQDHPARDMQDTFYLSRPAKARLPEESLVERIRRTHEDGGGTGSTGWGYSWNREEAARTVLRTHTTATSIRAIAANPKPPAKYFCVGRVFRNETVSYKHLPEFTQVDGIIVDEKASFRCLLGTLVEFYRQMGFEKVKFMPSFFPYTEPSAEVYVWFEAKKDWIELGGSGVFRPEVTRPLGCEVPVLAWGLGLERLAMLRYGLSGIRELYLSDLDFLREAPLCR
ncbi:MAG: phenylalanine--tRNA ligase subunit alpha [Planctomycetes bacterium]|nr:phenylalanine--tRNA ligase subunit alpha [Planctomycetota bacterium]